jgi:uncharacterized SAM-binding protein YcdF (DUF218 family)
LGAATLAALLLLGVILSFRLWLPFFGRWLVIADPLVPAQAIVPLAGGGERVNHAARLYKQGKAAWFVATNTPLDLPGIDHSYSDLVRRAALRGGVPEERFLVIPTLVYSTYEEALAIRRLAEMRGWDSLLIVTSPYHTRRRGPSSMASSATAASASLCVPLIRIRITATSGGKIVTMRAIPFWNI